MPYKLSKNGLCVEKADTGKTVKCHADHGKALAHLAALQINVMGHEKEQTMMTCPNCGAKVEAGAKACPECGKKMPMQQATKELGAADYLVWDPETKTGHLPIAKTAGTPDRGLAGAAWAALFSPGGFRGNPYSGPKKEEAQRKLRALYNRMDWPMPGAKDLVAALTKELQRGIKAFTKGKDQYIVIWTTNAFKDREGEIFSQKSIEDYVTRRDQTGIKDRVWFWHVKGTDFATVEWQGVIGKFLVEVAKVDKTVYGQKMFHALQHPEEYPQLLPEGWGSSHGYLYRASDKHKGVYSFFEKYESTVLPYHRASNTFGGLKEVIDMGKMTEEKMQALVTLVGKDKVKEILAAPEKATDILDLLGVDSKELTDGDEPEKPEPEATEAAETEEAEEDVSTTSEEQAESETKETSDVYELELSDELVSAIAAKVDVQGKLEAAKKEWIADTVKAVQTALIPALRGVVTAEVDGSKERVVSEALAGRLKLKPYSPTSAKDNVLDTTGSKEAQAQAAAEKAANEPVTGSDFVAKLAHGMLTGEVR